jgi:hypothetical protein
VEKAEVVAIRQILEKAAKEDKTHMWIAKTIIEAGFRKV